MERDRAPLREYRRAIDMRVQLHGKDGARRHPGVHWITDTPLRLRRDRVGSALRGRECIEQQEFQR